MPPGRTQHLVVFVRAPRLGAGKRRLARDIGAVAAQSFYRTELAGLLRRLRRAPGLTLWLAVTPDGAARPALWPAGFRLLPQGRGDLGRRMARAFRRLPAGPAVIVGSDIPDLGSEHVRAAFKALGRAEAVLGPAGDGGYWLIGLARTRPQPRTLFRGVRWSSPYAYEDTLVSLPKGWRSARVMELADIDDGGDHRRWRQRRRGRR